ncbi:hypothetical protein GGS24DRAFT_466323 [Hypoxylon argillaceum]|nr:hypothetical protein GGS24DRAFT_466323 [Hypoxylon argillaceum]
MQALYLRGRPPTRHGRVCLAGWLAGWLAVFLAAGSLTDRPKRAPSQIPSQRRAPAALSPLTLPPCIPTSAIRT